MPLLFMVILPQIDLRNKMSSQAANRLQGGFIVGEEEAARKLSGGYDGPSPELNIDPLGRNPEAGWDYGTVKKAATPGRPVWRCWTFWRGFGGKRLTRTGPE